MNIYVGNLSFRAKEQDVSDLFSTYGEVTSARIVRDKFTKRSRGFAFVEMSNDEAAKEAIQALHEKEFMERALVVNEAKPREERPKEENAE
ncbi:MAG: RNA-binding protein [Bacteroidetes bacterium]|nr:RNA-binding protein [Bacteroidota bacterium]